MPSTLDLAIDCTIWKEQVCPSIASEVRSQHSISGESRASATTLGFAESGAEAPEAAEPSNRQKKRLARRVDRRASKKNRLDAQAEIRKKYGLNDTAQASTSWSRSFPLETSLDCRRLRATRSQSEPLCAWNTSHLPAMSPSQTQTTSPAPTSHNMQPSASTRQSARSTRRCFWKRLQHSRRYVPWHNMPAKRQIG